MTLADVQGQPTATTTLERALRSRRVHHAYRFEGPDGVGKEMAAFGLAQALLCEAGEPLGCGRCHGCTRVVAISEKAPHVPVHPDVVLIARGLYAAGTLGESRVSEKQTISIEQIRTLVVARKDYPPFEGRARITIVRAAEELSEPAANALLKTLEEPRPNQYFVLLTSRPQELLPTIRSRTLPVRFGPLPSAVLRGILTGREVAADRLDGIVELAGGSVSAALELADGERVAEREGFADAVLNAVHARTFDAAVRLAESIADRAELTRLLEGLAVRFAADGRAAAGHDDRAALRAARQHAQVIAAIQRIEEFNAGSSHVLLQLAQELRAIARS